MVGVGRIASHLLAGLGMAVAPASVATVQQHFDRLRALASGLALAGSVSRAIIAGIWVAFFQECQQ